MANQKSDKKDVRKKATIEKEDATSKKWGDVEHDTSLHSTLKPHTGVGEYDTKHHRYRTNGG